MDKDTPQENRLDRIERKIDQISNALVTLARVEEKIAGLEERRIEFSTSLMGTTKKIDEVEIKTERLTERLDILSRVVWVAGIGMFGLVVQQIAAVIL